MEQRDEKWGTNTATDKLPDVKTMLNLSTREITDGFQRHKICMKTNSDAVSIFPHTMKVQHRRVSFAMAMAKYSNNIQKTGSIQRCGTYQVLAF